jgi:hypothetical protein
MYLIARTGYTLLMRGIGIREDTGEESEMWDAEYRYRPQSDMSGSSTL